jgi:Double-GTPase 1
MTTAAPKMLVLGGPDSGKSTYRAQLYQRIEHQEGELRLARSVEDMTALQDDVKRLVQGLQPMHTHLETYHSTTLAVKNHADRQFTLEFADYGGEQVRRIGESNAVPAPWVERAQQSSGWLFFLRIDQIRSTKSFMTDPIHTEPRVAVNGDSSHPERSAELNAIETLQRLLFVRGASLRHRLHSPRLGVLLSCWDELPNTERKQSLALVLEQRAPLFNRFIAANWDLDQFRVWGLSSTGRRLPETEPDEEFARKGPEHAGYVVLPDGKTSRDLTVPVSWLMRPM